jgi:hypothetical protein
MCSFCPGRRGDPGLVAVVPEKFQLAMRDAEPIADSVVQFSGDSAPFAHMGCHANPYDAALMPIVNHVSSRDMRPAPPR